LLSEANSRVMPQRRAAPDHEAGYNAYRECSAAQMRCSTLEVRVHC